MYVMPTNLGRNFGSKSSPSYSSWTMYREDPPAAQTTYATGNNPSKVKEARWDGWKIRDFHERLRKGELLPHTPWRRFSREGSVTGSLDLWKGPSNPVHYWTTGNYIPGNVDVWCVTEEEVLAHLPPLTDVYVGEAAAKIYESGWDALTFLAELTSIRGLFTNAVKKLTKLGLPSNWKRLSDDWLESRYGWRVLIYDILEISKLIATYNERRSRFSERAGDGYTSYTKDVETKSMGSYTVDDTKTTKIQVSYRGSVTADVVVPRVQFNIIQTAYELIPLSFVLDWFYTVGKSISAASFLALNPKYAASKSVQVRVTRTFDRRIGQINGDLISGDHRLLGFSSAELLVRQPCPVPFTPHSTVRLNPFKVIDLVGLTKQRIPRR